MNLALKLSWSLCLVLVLALGAGAATWRYEASASATPTAQSPCDCLGIQGTARGIESWQQHAYAPDEVYVGSMGNYGAVWAPDKPLSQYDICPITPVNGVTDKVIHAYKKTNASTTPNILSVEWFAVGKASGAAHQFQPGTDWWWRPTVNITDDAPIVETKSGSGSWQTVALQPEADPDPETEQNENDVRLSALITHKPDPQNPTGVVPNVNSTDGHFLGTAAIAGNLPKGSITRVVVPLHVTVSGSGDDVVVDDWKTYAECILATNMGS